MDAVEAIRHAARSEARAFRSGRCAEDVLPEGNEKVPYFCVSRSGAGYAVQGFNHRGHDNEPRMDFVCEFLRTSVLPYVHPKIDVGGYYSIELHDSYSYLPTAESYRNCLTFSRRRGDAHMTVIPNPYQMANYGGAFDAASDSVPWDKKQDLVFFAGSTTGARDPAANQRIQACRWALANRSIARFSITNVVQMSDEAFRAKVPEWASITASPVPAAENYNYKYLLSLPGNTCAWSRLPMILASKSLLLNAHQPDMEWFYPFLLEDTHFLGCDLSTLPAKRAFAASNPQVVQYIIANANRFYGAFLGRNQAALYMVHLLEEIGSNSRP